MSIKKVELLPTEWDNVEDRAIIDRLNQTLQVAEQLYASVAFWTISPYYLSEHLVRLLASPRSFCCVDLRGRTRVPQLLAFYRAGATRFFLFIKRLTNSSELGLNRHLLHTKLLLFDLPDGRAELWVGSHNFTDFALAGGNREASAVLSLSQQSALYHQAKAYLHALQAECFPFDPALLDQYLQLQGNPDDVPELECYVLPLYWNSALPGYGPDQLARQTVLLLNNNESAANRLDALYGRRQPLLVWALDLHTGQVSLWNARLQNAGRIDRTRSSSDIQFGDRLLAVLEDPEQLPYLAPRVREIGPKDLSRFSHLANIWLYENVTRDILPVPPPDSKTKAHWQRDAQATAALQKQLQRTVAAARNYGMQLSDNLPGEQLSQTGLNATGWLEQLRQEASRKHTRSTAVARLPVIERPVFAPAQPVAVRDPLQQLAQLSADERQRLRTQYEQPLRAQYFNERAPAINPPPAPKLPTELLEKLLHKYRLLLQ